MNHENIAGVPLLICLLAVSLVAAPAAAQETGQTGLESISEKSAAELVTDYLRQDVFLSPGVGLKKVRIGMSFDQVRAVWGPPTRRGFEDRVNNKWVYEVADHTRITLVGDANVGIIRVSGSFTSPYVTSEGASFGMALHQLATIYGPTGVDTDEVVYEERGIGFALDKGQISEIRIFEPE